MSCTGAELDETDSWRDRNGDRLGISVGAMVAVGLATLGDSQRGLVQLTSVIAPPLVLLSALSATGTLLLARKAQRLADRRADHSGSQRDEKRDRRLEVAPQQHVEDRDRKSDE